MHREDFTILGSASSRPASVTPKRNSAPGLPVAHNRLTDHWRSLQHRPAAPGDAEERTLRQADPQTPERQLSAFEERRRLQLALQELPADQREVLVLRLEQELSLEQIGELTGVGRETVKSRLRYALDKLRQRLDQ